MPIKIGSPQFFENTLEPGVLLTHIAMSHELQSGTKRTAAPDLPYAQPMRPAPAIEFGHHQQEHQQGYMQLQHECHRSQCEMGCNCGD